MPLSTSFILIVIIVIKESINIFNATLGTDHLIFKISSNTNVFTINYSHKNPALGDLFHKRQSISQSLNKNLTPFFFSLFHAYIVIKKSINNQYFQCYFNSDHHWCNLTSTCFPINQKENSKSFTLASGIERLFPLIKHTQRAVTYMLTDSHVFAAILLAYFLS